jgi:peptide-methionine (S)-S-oxide reductase
MIRRLSLSRLSLVTALAAIVGLGVCTLAFGSSEGRKLPDPKQDPAVSAGQGDQVAVMAGGCFWGVEAVFAHVKGVKQVWVGYSGGNASTANYSDVSDGDTGHAESVKVQYDPSQISYGQLLKVFFSVALDPTELNRQGPDSGTQYRSVIFYGNDTQKQVADAYIAQLAAAKAFPAPIVTQVVPLKAFYMAESYHQDYARLHPDDSYIVYNDAPKVVHLQQLYPQMYKPWDETH